MRIAVVGTGIAGNIAAYELRDRFDVTVFEAAGYVGGHTNTVDVEDGGRSLAVDTGFIVFNDRTYPNFIKRYVWFRSPTGGDRRCLAL